MSILNTEAQLITLSHAVSKFTVGMEGNVSARINEQEFLIKASGTCLDTLATNDLVLCNNDGKQLSNFTKKPSIETSFHAWFYHTFDINYIAHTHPTNTLKILCSSMANKFSIVRLFPDQVVFNGKISCVIPYAHPGECLMTQIEKHVENFLKKENFFPKLILLENHGIICTGSTTKECIIQSEICEKAAEVFIGSINLGMLNTLSDESIEKIKVDKNEIYRTTI